MRKNAREVIEAFKDKRPHGGGGIWTDGKAIYSYKMKIAWREKGRFIVVSRESSPSSTTTNHITACAVALSEAARHNAKRPKITKVPLGHGELVTSKKAAVEFTRIPPGESRFRLLPPTKDFSGIDRLVAKPPAPIRYYEPRPRKAKFTVVKP